MTLTLDQIRRAGTPESWDCIDCGMNTAPGLLNAAETVMAFWKQGHAPMNFDERCEVYTVKSDAWQAAGMAWDGGCLCVGCLEVRLDRRLRPKDFKTKNGLNWKPCTDRLMSRRMGRRRNANQSQSKNQS
jgi:hypothetical protein